MDTAASKFSFKKVVAIEDTKIDQYIIQSTMKKCNFSEQLIVFGSAGDALSHFDAVDETMPDLPDLIFLDIHMPKMNGFEFLAALNEKHDSLKHKVNIVLLTSSLDPIDKKLSSEFPNIKLFLNKPLNTEKLEKISAMMCVESN